LQYGIRVYMPILTISIEPDLNSLKDILSFASNIYYILADKLHGIASTVLACNIHIHAIVIGGKVKDIISVTA